ncbi:hypothetical protein HH195_12155 (plasmid) [Sarcina sp. JB2]|uniref:Uncharacterized protein n=1 Tax=Candidatus Sarcina troglodytae TaxID=2726954 RepID=A0ACD1BIJ2_9CLOT|nr:hypothetical protein [Sarcina sp. JB2]QPJ86718.1 hypothetical protein HH195_12155 [Sarcina sp. JB2]
MLEKKRLDEIVEVVKRNTFKKAIFSDTDYEINVDIENKIVKINIINDFQTFLYEDTGNYISYPITEIYRITRNLCVYECTLEKLDEEYHKEVPINEYHNIFLLERYSELFYAISCLKKMNYEIDFPAYEERLKMYKKEIEKRGLNKEINKYKKQFRIKKDKWNLE